MKIATKLKIAALAPVFMALISGSAIVFSNHAVQDAQQNLRTVREVVSSVNDLNSLVYSYMLYQEQRPKEQFLAEHKHITQLLSAIQLQNIEQKQLLNKLYNDVESMKGLFVKMTVNYERLKLADADPTVKEAGERLGGQLLSASSETVADGLALARFVNDSLINNERRLYLFVFVLIVTATIVLTLLLAWAMKKISLSLERVSRGAEIVGSGNLHYFIEENADDEIGSLCRAFNDMTRKLSTTYDVLESEIGERKRAEMELLTAKDELEVRVEQRTAEVSQALKELRAETDQRLRAVEELRSREQMLMQQSRLAAMGEMLVNISHQWRQPLNVVGLLLQDLTRSYHRGTFTRESLEKSVARARELIAHMSQTIDDFRNYLTPDRTKLPFNLKEVVEKTISMFQESLKEIKVDLRDPSDQSIVINGFKNEYAQAIINILVNAREAFRERGIKDPVIIVSISKEGGKSVVTIADNAGGIADGVIDRIFDPYFTTKAPDKGTGIGLFMSKTIIEKNMNGSLTVHNSDAGAVFRIEV